MTGIHRLPVDSPHKGSVMLRVFTSWRHYGFAADGRAFGELALLSEDCIRTASVIADEHTDLIIINRDLYSRSMDRVMRQVGGEGEHTLLWRHNGRGSVSNHQPHDCLLNRLFRRRSKKTSKLRVTGLWAGNSPGAGEFPAQMASNAENVSIWWRHHVILISWMWYSMGTY